jgi:hypothetical protein
MPDNLASAPQAQNGSGDGSLADAALNMPDLIDFNEAPATNELNTRVRDIPTGRFKQKDEASDAELEAVARSNAKTKDEIAAEPDADEQASAVEEEYFELPAEKEGEKPRRLKAMEVWEKAQRADTLERQLAEARRDFVPPESYDQQVIELVNAQANTSRTLRMYAHMMQPEQPDLELINEESPRYNPGLYQRQMAMAQAKHSQVQRIQAEIAEIERDQQMKTHAVQRNQRIRCAHEVQKFWPEVIGPNADKEADRVRGEISDYYGHLGFTPEVMATITNPGAFAVLKDALSYRRGQKARETAVKVVRAKPKLVKGAARDTQSPSNRRSAQGMQRLQQSGSVDDAAAALDGLI